MNSFTSRKSERLTVVLHCAIFSPSTSMTFFVNSVISRLYATKTQNICQQSKFCFSVRSISSLVAYEGISVEKRGKARNGEERR